MIRRQPDLLAGFRTPRASLLSRGYRLCSQGKLLIGNCVVISFLRGRLINHDTPPHPRPTQSKPIAPGWADKLAAGIPSELLSAVQGRSTRGLCFWPIELLYCGHQSHAGNQSFGISVKAAFAANERALEGVVVVIPGEIWQSGGNGTSLDLKLQAVLFLSTRNGRKKTPKVAKKPWEKVSLETEWQVVSGKALSSQRGWLATTKECHSTIVPYARKVRSSTSERL